MDHGILPRPRSSQNYEGRFDRFYSLKILLSIFNKSKNVLNVTGVTSAQCFSFVGSITNSRSVACNLPISEHCQAMLRGMQPSHCSEHLKSQKYNCRLSFFFNCCQFVKMTSSAVRLGGETAVLTVSLGCSLTVIQLKTKY
jgi:hypothetical protein